jgi:hypothetical protein
MENGFPSAGGADGEAQQLGTNLQPGGPGRVVVDLEADFAGFLHEVDDAARFYESLGFAHGEDGGAAEALYDFREALCLGVADEKDVAVRGLRQRSQ